MDVSNAWQARNTASSARDENSVVAFPSDGVSRLAATGSSGFRKQIDGLGWPRANLCIDTGNPREEASAGRAG
jgi:hypothetical protein